MRQLKGLNCASQTGAMLEKVDMWEFTSTNLYIPSKSALHMYVLIEFELEIIFFSSSFLEIAIKQFLRFTLLNDYQLNSNRCVALVVSLSECVKPFGRTISIQINSCTQ